MVLVRVSEKIRVFESFLGSNAGGLYMTQHGLPLLSLWAPQRGNKQTSQRNPPVFGVRLDWLIKILRGNAFFGLMYILIGFSLVSTLSFWSHIRHGVALKPRIVNSRAAESQDKNVFNLTGPHPLQWYNALGHLNVGELFAIKPADQKDTAEKSSTRKTESPIKTENDRPFFIAKNIPPQVVCPELVIPGLVLEKALDLKDLNMNQSEIYVLGEQIQRSKDCTKEGNRQLNEIYSLTDVRKPIMDSMHQLAVKVGNYSWFPGGHWKPTNCLPRWKVAIIIPYRDRAYHLPIILKYLTPMLRRQLLEFAFYVVEQNNSLAFNRAMLMNVGFLESFNFSSWDCFIFHDVDHIPLSDFNYYGCSGMPRHFLSGADRWKYKLPYNNFFGAVTGFTTGNIRLINGFPNVYWGWGGEDDEIWKRVQEAGLPISRATGPTGYYNVITHHHQSAPKMKERMHLLRTFKQRNKIDGLKNIRYKKPHVEFHPLYTMILVDIQMVTTAIQHPSLPAKQQEKDTKTQTGDKLTNAKKAVENGNANAQNQSQNKRINAKKAVKNGNVNAQGQSQNEKAQPAAEKNENNTNGKQR